MSFRRTIPSENDFARLAWLCLLTACAIVAIASDVPAAGLERADAPEERWYLYRLAGQDAGHLHESIHRAANSVTTSVETFIVINRLGSKVEIKGSAVFTETADGRLQSVRSELSSSRQTTTLDVRVEANAVALQTSTGGVVHRRGNSQDALEQRPRKTGRSRPDRGRHGCRPPGNSSSLTQSLQTRYGLL